MAGYYKVCFKCGVALPIGEVYDEHKCNPQVAELEERIKVLEKEVAKLNRRFA